MEQKSTENKETRVTTAQIMSKLRRRPLTMRERFLRRLHFGLMPLVLVSLAAMVLLSFSRGLLTLWQLDQVPDNSVPLIFLQGLRIDFASVCGLFGVPFLLLALAGLVSSKLLFRILLVFFKFYSGLAFAFLVFNEVATVSFVEEYGVRPNHIYVQYLIYPREVFLTLWGSYKFELILNCILTLLAFVGGYALASWAFKRYRKGNWLYSLVSALLILCIVPLGIRSTLGHRPLNPAMVSFCNNAMANSLPLNSSYSAVYALAHLDDTSIDADAIYKIAYDKEVVARGKELSARTPVERYNDRCPFNQQIQSVVGVYDGALTARLSSEPQHKPYNVVIIIEESLGDNFVQSQGGFPVTPYLESLRKEGWWFENMYAAGHRSVRGIEAITASFPPSPLSSIVKLPSPMRPYATFFKVLQEAGYSTSFIYGGESHFDNMRAYFLENGMDTLVEEKDYKNPSFVGSWGVSDEDLFNRAHENFKQMHKEGKTFCSVILSSSFHAPFDIPDGKIAPLDFPTKEPARLMAAKYADFALGSYLEKAKKEGGYYNDTIFLVIADHESRVRGTGAFPLHDFTIPAVIIAPNVVPHVDKRQVSQIDMGMTLLSLAGIEGEIPNVGQSMTRSDIKERALMQFNDIFGLLKKDKFISLAPQTEPYMYKVIDGEKLKLIPEVDEEMLQEAIELSNLGGLVYRYEYMSSNCIHLKTKVEAPVQSAADSAEKEQDE